MKKLSLMTAVFLLLTVLTCSLMPPTYASKLTDSEYADLFKRAARGSPEGNMVGELETAFLSDPMGFVKALAKEDYHTMYNVHFVTMNFADWASNPERNAHRDALLRIAYGEKLTQSQRRVVRFMLLYTKVMKDYAVYTDKIDYAELFARSQEAGSNSTYHILNEIIEVYHGDPKAFFEALALENNNIQDKVIFDLAYELYYQNYDRELEGKIINALKNNGELSTDAQRLITDFWAEVDSLIQQSGPLPTRPTTPPSTGPTTILGQPKVSVDRFNFYEGADITFTFSNVGNRTLTLYIQNPDGTEQSYQPPGSVDSMTFRFDAMGSYTAWVTAEENGGIIYSSRITFNIVTKYTPPTSQPPTIQPPTIHPPTIQTSIPDASPEEKPLNIHTPWIIIGVVAVIFGVQAVAIVVHKKKSPPAEEDFDE